MPEGSRLILILFLLIAPALPSSARPPESPVHENYVVGSIIIKTAARQLLYVRSKNHTEVYSIAVGRQGRKWTGMTKISRKVRNPTWAPPEVIRKENPGLPTLVKAGPNNPLGAAVLVLGDGTYGIHGTNRPETIGTNASYGCFRMHNADILELFNKVEIGTAVTVLP